MARPNEQVEGYCPMGCGRTLFLAAGGHITCSYIECPNPCAVDELLDDGETEHIVVLDDKGFVVEHPLRERLRGELFECQLHGWLRAQAGPPFKPGRYRAREQEGDPVAPWRFEEL